MESIVKKLQKTLEIESLENSKQRDFKELEQLIEKLDNLNLSKRSDYNLPQIDTIGKRLYNSLNNR
jgi:hypothetical protein